MLKSNPSAERGGFNATGRAPARKGRSLSSLEREADHVLQQADRITKRLREIRILLQEAKMRKTSGSGAAPRRELSRRIVAK